MLLLDVLTRYFAVAFLLITAVLAFRDGKNSTPARFAVLAVISVAALLLSTAPAPLKLPQVPFAIAHTLDIPNIVFIWWLCLSMFQDEFKLKLWHWAVFIIYISMGFAYRLLEYGSIKYIPNGFELLLDVVTLAMMLHLVFVALRGRADDLVEPRRRLRLFFVLALTIGSSISILVENLFIENFGAEVTLFRALITLPLSVWGLLWLTKFQPEKLSFQASQSKEIKPAGLDPRDAALHKCLVHEMQEKQIYLDPDLTIRKLAAKLKTPEHRLRVLINQGLGHRNFSSFLNGYRIEEVKKAFNDPRNSRIPVLTIAMDAGYGSLAPFNRVFLLTEGITPSAYRQNLLAEKLVDKK